MANFGSTALVGLAVTCLGTSVVAETPAEELYDALRMDESIAIMQQEGLAYGEELSRSSFGQEPDAEWMALVGHIYDLDVMQQRVRGDFLTALDGQDIAPMLEFFTTNPGQQFVTMELTAREAMLDEDVENTAREMAAIAMADETERFLLLQNFVEANDMIELNVAAALNSNLEFSRGFMQGLGTGQGTEEDMLRSAWEQEAEIRTGTTEWVYSYLMLVAQPMSDEDLQAYIDFSETDAGQVLNGALFSAFDNTYNDIMRALGIATGQELAKEDI